MATEERPPPVVHRQGVYIRMDWIIRAFVLMVLNFLTSSEFYVPTFQFKAPFPEFRPQPEEGVHDVTDVTDDADVTDDVVTATAKLAAAVVNDDEPEVTSDLAEVFTSEHRQDGMNACKEVSTLTDVCYNENLAEVDLVSLIEEQLPRYVLRADTLTDFAGYDNSDWIQTPCLPPDTDLNLSPIIIEETLKYFTLCADRVSQMTKTYNDIEAVTRLLEEKERDLELAARIGQNLLDKNKELEEKNEQLEEQLVQANDSVAQLRHEISMKDALLHAYIQDYDSETPGESPNKAFLGLGHLDGLQKKVRGLEEENLTLHYETAQLKVQTCDLEEKEEKLVKDAVRQLADINGQIHVLQDELFCKTEITVRQQEEITTLMAKIISLEAHIKRLTIENAELTSHLSAAQESQRELTTELGDQRDKYAELLVLLQETQEEAKSLRGKAGPSAVRHQYGHYTPFLPQGSLAFELEDSLKKDMTYPEGYSPSDRRSHNKRVMETAKIVKRHGPHKSSSLMSIPGSNMSTSGNETCESIAGSSNRSSLYLSESESFNEGYNGDVDSNYGSGTTLGRPGIPGSNDLETALRRLTLRKANEINESILQEVDEKRKSGGSSTPTGYQTPDSLMSTGSGSNFSDLSRFSGGYSGYGFRIPEKLQIVKPMEGSMTLHQWQRLATPHLGGFLDPRPGIQIKGEKPLEEQEVYTLSDYEEDGEADYNLPGKADVWSQSTFTYTTSKIMHPTDQYDITSLSSVYGGTPRPVVASSEAPPSRNAALSTSTFSMNLGLAQMLKERGILPTGMRSQTPTPKVMVNGVPMPSKKPALRHTPRRFGSIVTETMSGNKRSQTEVIYTSASTSTVLTNTNIPPIEGISDTAMPMLRPDTYDIVDQVLSNQLEKTASSTAAAVNILGMGLNTILPLNDRSGLMTRQDVIEKDKKLRSPGETSTDSEAKGDTTPKAKKKTVRPTYIGDLPPLGMSRSSGVLTRVAAASSRATREARQPEKPKPIVNVSQPQSSQQKPTQTSQPPVSSTMTTPKQDVTLTSAAVSAGPSSSTFSMSSSGGMYLSATSMSASMGHSRLSSSSTASASMGSTLSTSTLSSSYYHSPISFSAQPEMVKKTEVSGSAAAASSNSAAVPPSASGAGLSLPSESPVSASSGSGAVPPSSSGAGLSLLGETLVSKVHTPGTMSQSLIKHLANIRMRRRQEGFAAAFSARPQAGLSSILSPSPVSPDSSQKNDVD